MPFLTDVGLFRLMLKKAGNSLLSADTVYCGVNCMCTVSPWLITR